MSNLVTEQFRKILIFTKRFSKEILIALVLAVFAAVTVEIVKDKTREATLRNNRKAVATIVSQNKEKGLIIQGSGFFIDSTGDLVTNYHVIKEADWKTITAKLQSGAYYTIKDIIGIDKKADIAIIRFEATETPFVQMGDSDQLHHGDEIVVIGTPVGLESTVSTGVISNPDREIKGLRFIQFTAPVSHGSSGGALFTKSGQTVGVVTSMMRPSETQNINFAVPINLVRRVLKGQERSFSEESPEFFYFKGIRAENKKDYDEAIRCFSKAIELDDKYVDPYIELGQMYYEKGLYDQELAILKKAIELAPNNSDAYYYLAMACEDKGLYHEAALAYQKVIDIKPNDKDAIYQLGILYIVQGKKHNAAQLLPRLAELNPGLSNELKQLLNRVK